MVFRASECKFTEQQEQNNKYVEPLLDWQALTKTCWDLFEFH